MVNLLFFKLFAGLYFYIFDQNIYNLFPSDKQFVVEFDFLGKDSIRYHNDVAVEKRVFKNLAIFKEGKKGGDDLFDRLNTSILNEHLNKLMDGL